VGQTKREMSFNQSFVAGSGVWVRGHAPASAQSTYFVIWLPVRLSSTRLMHLSSPDIFTRAGSAGGSTPQVEGCEETSRWVGGPSHTSQRCLPLFTHESLNTISMSKRWVA
jgi:hypothetical protein